MFGSDGVVRQLLKMESVDVNHRDMWEQTPIFCAVTSDHVSTVKLLLDGNGIDPNVLDQDNMPPLYYAVIRDHVETTRFLLDSGQVDVDVSFGIQGRTALSYAVGNGLEEITKLLLRTGSVDPESRDLAGKTPFAWAVERGKVGTAKLLLETGKVDLNSRSSHAHRTPLHHAIVCNPAHPDEDVIQMLVELDGVDINAESEGRTPIMFAVERKLVASVKVLMGSGRVDPNLRGYHGLTVLHFAASLGRIDIANVLLDYDSVDCNAISGEGFTPLGTAAYHGRGAILRMLLHSGKVADVNHRCGSLGGTPLWWAAARGRKAAVKALLDHGGKEADVRAENDDGETPLDIAQVYEHSKTVRLLVQRSHPDRRAYPIRFKDDVFEGADSGGEESLGSLFECETG